MSFPRCSFHEASAEDCGCVITSSSGIPDEVSAVPLSYVYTCRCGKPVAQNWLGDKLVWWHFANTDIVRYQIEGSTDDYIECLDGSGPAAPTTSVEVSYYDPWSGVAISSDREYTWTSWNDDEVRNETHLLRKLTFSKAFADISRKNNVVRYEVDSMYVAHYGDRLMMFARMVFDDLTQSDGIIMFHGTPDGPEDGPKRYSYMVTGFAIVAPETVGETDEYLARLRQ